MNNANGFGKVAGAVGCNNGWIVVEIDLKSGETGVRVVERVKELLEGSELGVIAVDVPIGFPDTVNDAGRACEKEARDMLERGRSNRVFSSRVFSSPSRHTLVARDQKQASEINRRHHYDNRGVSIQCFCMFPRILEVDALMPEAQGRIVECRPELSFWAINNHKLIVDRKRTRVGRDYRIVILRRHGFSDAFLHLRPARKGVITARPHDFIGACAAAWTARRVARGEAEVLPKGGGEKDAKGVKMEMWY